MKTVEEIYQGMKAVFEEKAGYTLHDAGDMAVRLYAAAAEVQTLYYQSQWLLEQCFPQTAAGEYLDRHGALRNLSRNAATCAVGEITFSISEAAEQNLTVPQGTVCLNARQTRFITMEAGTLSAGTTSVTVSARAVETGSSGNAAAGSITEMAALPAGIERCGNANAFSGGTEAEGDERFRARILESYDRLPNGANAAYYELMAENHAGVTAAKAVSRARGTGTVNVYIATANGLPGSALLEEVYDDLSAKREIAVDLQVLAPTAVSVQVTAALTVKEGYEFADVSARAQAAITAFFEGKLLGKGVTRAQLGDILYHLPGVANYTLTAPAADLAASATALPVLGAVTLRDASES